MELLGRARQILFGQQWVGPDSRRHRPEVTIALTTLILLSIGLVVQFAIGQALALQSGEGISENYYVVRHTISLGLGLVAMYIAWKVPIKYWIKLSPYMLIAGFLASIFTLVLSGGEANRWIQIGFFSFQPVEVLKLGFILWSAVFIVNAKRDPTYRTSWKPIQPLIILASLATLVVVVLQKDLGSMAVVMAVLIAMLWASGFSLRLFLVLTAAVVLLGSVFIASTEYRRERFRTFLEPTADCVDEGYQVCQALISVGSGGLFGRGIGQSVQVYGYLPEANNDSVFAIYAEIAGFIGVMILFAVLYKHYQVTYKIARKSEEVLMLITVGILAWFSVQTIMNIGAMIGLLPLKGITLPYISYGGSSLMLVLFASGLLLQLSTYTMYSNEGKQNESSTHGRRVRRSRYTVSRG